MNKYIGTFGWGQKYNNENMTGKAVEFKAENIEQARNIMKKHFGLKYANVYLKSDWDKYFETMEFAKETVYPLNQITTHYDPK